MTRSFLKMWGRPLILLVSIVLTPPGFSQTVTTGEITGTVLDLTDAVVIGATVLLKSVDTGESREVQTNASGAYRFTFVKPGTYEISGTSASLKSDIGSLVANVGQVQVLNLHLKVQAAPEVIVVAGTAPLIDTDNANIVYTLSTRQLDLLPLPGGDLVSAAYSVPGVIINNQHGWGNFVVQGVGSVSNLFTVNGMDDMIAYSNQNNSGATGLLLGANEIQEVSIVQNAYEGQYGRQAGAQVNYVTKSGTNAYHGNLAYNYNGTRMNANDFFSNTTGTPRPNLVSNQYAASLGGHIVKEKLFFFVDTEGLRFTQPRFSPVVAIPSPAMESYSLRTIQPSQVPLYQKMFDLYNNAPGHDQAVPVTTGNGLLQDSSGALGCGSLANTPTGTGGIFGQNVSCAQAWQTNITQPTSEWLLSSRVDYNLSGNQRMFFRFKTDHSFVPAITNLISPLFNAVSSQPDYEGQLGHTLVITPGLVNNFFGAVTYNDYVTAVTDLPDALKAFPFRINIGNGGANGSTIANIGAPAGYPLGDRAGQFQIADDVSYNAGRHSLRTGISYRYNRVTDLSYSGFVASGAFNFVSLNGLADGVLDGAGRYQQNFTAAPVQHVRMYNVGVYVQDQWSVNPRLKLTATVRFDRSDNPNCVESCYTRLTNPFPDIGKGLSTPYNQSIQTGQAHAFYHIEPIVPQPRVGLAYTPHWSRNTVLRGGIGVFSDVYPGFFASLLGGNAPNVFQSVIKTGLVDTGAGSAPAIAAASANAFESQFASGATLGQLQQAVAPASFAAPSYYSVPSTLRTPKYLAWHLEVEHQMGARNLFTVRYMGNHGYDIFVNNPNVNGSATPALYPNGFAGLPAVTPDPRFGIVSQFTNDGYSNYNALVTVFRRAFGHGFQGQISYTWSHALDTVSNGGLLSFSFVSPAGQINPADLGSLNYSNADYDVRHNVTADFIWQNPVRLKNRVMNTAFGGWSVGTRLNAHTGTPFSVVDSRISGFLSASFGGTALADVIDPKIQLTCGRSGIDAPCFTSGAFAAATSQADLGNLPRNSFRGPGFFDVDSSLYKTVSVGERMQFTFGASAYNLLNHPNFSDPNADLARSGLGLIKSTIATPSGPYGLNGGPSARVVVLTGKFRF